jgi:hypothetical protein
MPDDRDDNELRRIRQLLENIFDRQGEILEVDKQILEVLTGSPSGDDVKSFGGSISTPTKKTT